MRRTSRSILGQGCESLRFSRAKGPDKAPENPDGVEGRASAANLPRGGVLCHHQCRRWKSGRESPFRPRKVEIGLDFSKVFRSTHGRKTVCCRGRPAARAPIAGDFGAGDAKPRAGIQNARNRCGDGYRGTAASSRPSRGGGSGGPPQHCHHKPRRLLPGDHLQLGHISACAGWLSGHGQHHLQTVPTIAFFPLLGDNAQSSPRVGMATAVWPERDCFSRDNGSINRSMRRPSTQSIVHTGPTPRQPKSSYPKPGG